MLSRAVFLYGTRSFVSQRPRNLDLQWVRKWKSELLAVAWCERLRLRSAVCGDFPLATLARLVFAPLARAIRRLPFKFVIYLVSCLRCLALTRPASVLASLVVVRSKAIWLILPVVICLSQRLSHACPSTSLTKVKPRMAH